MNNMHDVSYLGSDWQDTLPMESPSQIPSDKAEIVPMHVTTEVENPEPKSPCGSCELCTNVSPKKAQHTTETPEHSGKLTTEATEEKIEKEDEEEVSHACIVSAVFFIC